MVGVGQSARQGLRRALMRLGLQEGVDRLLESPFQEMGVAGVRNRPGRRKARLARQMEAMDGIEEEHRPDALV